MSAELAQRVYAVVLRDDDELRADLPLPANLSHAQEELRKHRTLPEYPLRLKLMTRQSDAPYQPHF